MSDTQLPFDEDAFWQKAIPRVRTEMTRLDGERAVRPQPAEQERREAQRR